MDIKTEFEIGESIFFLNFNKVVKGEIESIKTETFDKGRGYNDTDVFYKVKTEAGNITVTGKETFKSKKELLESL